MKRKATMRMMRWKNQIKQRNRKRQNNSCGKMESKRKMRRKKIL